MCELYEGLVEMKLEDCLKLQDGILADLSAPFIVRLGNCDYYHAFHADCIA